jgi:hypothetical protein
MARKWHTAEQVVNLLRQIEVAVATGKTTAVACKEAEISGSGLLWVLNMKLDCRVSAGDPKKSRSLLIPGIL